MQNCSSRHDRAIRSSGKILVSLALVAFTLMAFAGLAIDMGRMEFFRRRLQTAADSGAIGGARELQVNGPTDVVTAARDDVTTNGYTSSVNGATVNVNFPPTSGPYTGNNRYVEVVVSKPYPTTFFRAININTMNLKARAVGGLSPSNYCIIALNPTASGAIDVWGNATVQSPGCEVISDSSAADALKIGNSACLTAKAIDVVGGYQSGGCVPSPTPETGSSFIYDPLYYLAVPSYSTCDYTKFSTNKTETLNPGTYCGGIKITGNGTTTFNPGVYVLLGGGMEASGNGTVQGTGITFYNTGDTTYPYDDFKLGGTTTYHLGAPTSGPYEAILYFQDRKIAGSSQGSVFTGTNSSTFDGLIYARAGRIEFNGTSSVNGYTSIIADTIAFTGNSVLKNSYQSLSSGGPIKNGALIE